MVWEWYSPLQYSHWKSLPCSLSPTSNWRHKRPSSRVEIRTVYWKKRFPVKSNEIRKQKGTGIGQTGTRIVITEIYKTKCTAMFSEVLQTNILDVNQSFYMIRTKFYPSCALLLLSLEPVIFDQNLSLMLLGAPNQLHQIRQTFQYLYNFC